MKPRLLVTTLYGAVTLFVVAAPLHAASQEERLQLLERRVGQISELTLEMQSLKRENSQLRGEIETLQHAMETLKRKQRDLYLDVDQRLSGMQQGGAAPVSSAAPVAPVPTAAPVSAPVAATAAPQPQTATPAPVPQAALQPAGEDEQAAYRAAYEMLKPERQQYREAIGAFDAFLAKYPNSELAPNAQYWRGEASYVIQDNDGALAAFRKVVDGYPHSTKVPGALLKIGYILHATGQPAEARQTLQRVIKEYPGTSAADMARERLQKIAAEQR